MDKRMVEFIRALRAAGVRISVAESQDALRGAQEVGIWNAETFKTALRTTLVKEHRDEDTFDYFFPLFFSANQPPLEDIQEQLTPEQEALLEQAMQALLNDNEALRELLEQLLNGQPLTDEQLQALAEMAGMQNGSEMYQRGWFERRMMNLSGLTTLGQMLDALRDMLAEQGMSDEQIQALLDMLRQNMRGMGQQISAFAGLSLAQQMAERPPTERPDLLDVPFGRLSDSDIETLRDEMRRLAARLRSRNALRQRRANDGKVDLRKTLRRNMQYGGVPMEIAHKTRHKKPSLVLICDLSTSMRYMVEFMLTLVYQLQDQVRRTHSFIFIDDMREVTMDLEEHDTRVAVAKIMLENPPGYYSTDLGNSLNTFARDHYGTIDSRTTVIIMGDGRNNYNNPRLDIAQDIQRKARRVFWFCPEARSQWGTGDSDMHLYAALANDVFLVRTLRDLANSVDHILADS
jgi:uncharacterized protein with von Willebrand factor type A (vWA) domain